jgi:hypothetical protein
MGGGRETLTLIPTCAMDGIGAAVNNAKSNVPQNAFFIL